MKLRTKLIGGFLCVVALTIVVGSVALWGTRRLDTAGSEAVKRAQDANSR